MKVNGYDIKRLADLRWANLCGANLGGPDLGGADLVVDLGQESRGYRVVLLNSSDGVRVMAGCRYFTIKEARSHWGSKSYDDTNRGRDYIDRIEAGLKICERRGWFLK